MPERTDAEPAVAEPEGAAHVQDFLVPDLGEGLEEATVVEWLVTPGAVVALNQPLCEVETAKAVVQIPSPYAGTVVTLGGAAGETLAVGTVLVRIEVAGPAGAATAEAAPTAPARRATLVGYGHDDAIDQSRRSPSAPARRAGTAPARPGDAGGSAGGRPRAKPPVRLLARRLGVDLHTLAPGSGPGGIVTRADVEAAATHGAEVAPASATNPVTDPTTGTASGSERGSTTTIPVRGIRAAIAARMTTSRRAIPDATCGVTVDCTELLALRQAANAALERRGSSSTVTPFALICHLVVLALRDHPILNSSYDEDGPEIVLHDEIRLGIGTATERGLLVPVVRHADALGLVGLSDEIARLAEGGRAGTLTPAELAGSTFTISNFGALGLDEGVPVINHPEAAIVGVGSVRPRPHVVDGEVVARPTASITLAFDHRVCDGADAGSFLSRLRELIEAPSLALVSS